MRRLAASAGRTFILHLQHLLLLLPFLGAIEGKGTAGVLVIKNHADLKARVQEYRAGKTKMEVCPHLLVARARAPVWAQQ